MLVNANALCIPLADESVQCVVTSPPYVALRDYQVDGQIGLEPTLEEYIANIVAVGREIWRVLRKDGTFWLNIGDGYCNKESSSRANRTDKTNHRVGGWGKNAKTVPHGLPIGLKPKDLMMIPARIALALQADGWWLRSEIVWAKPNPMPNSVTDRPTSSHEMIYLLTKSKTYYYDAEAVKEPVRPDSIRRAQTGWNGNEQRGYVNGPQNHMSKYMGSEKAKRQTTRNQRDVWTIATESYDGAHYATFPTEIPRRAILAGTSHKGHCPKCGKGWIRVMKRNVPHVKLNQDELKEDTAAKGLPGSSGRTRTALDRIDEEHKNPGYTTLGWQPLCKCNAGDPIPAIVLDPFCGSGTTGEVCRKLNRRFIGLDLSMKYLRENALPRAEYKQTEESLAELPLFGGNGADERVLKQDAAGNPTYTGFNARWKESLR